MATSKGQSDLYAPNVLQTRHSVGSTALPTFDRGMPGGNLQGHVGSSPLGHSPLGQSASSSISSERPWPSQQGHAGVYVQSPAGLSTVPETQQQPAPPQAILRAKSLQPSRIVQVPGSTGLKQRVTRVQDDKDPHLSAERVRWSDRPVMSGHF